MTKLWWDFSCRIKVICQSKGNLPNQSPTDKVGGYIVGTNQHSSVHVNNKGASSRKSSNC